MEKIATENLFLLEFLVDDVILDQQYCTAGEGERCVSFQFLDNAPLDVCEEDFSPSSKQPCNGKESSVKTGKSCLFSLSPAQAKDAINQFDVCVTIFKKMPAGWLPEKIEMGETLISIVNLFSELINSIETSEGGTPTAKTLKDLFDINNAKGDVIGKIGVYIRMSCFGKLIVTQFQMNLEDKSVLFKDKEGKSLYRYKKAGKGGKDDARRQTCTARTPMSPGMNRMCPTPGMQNQYPMPGMQPTSMPPMAGNMNMSCPTPPCVMVQPPDNGLNKTTCPLKPCIMDQGLMAQYSQAISFPCQECGARPNAPCKPTQGMGMGMNTGMGNPMDAMLTPCMECGNLPRAPCLPPQPQQQFGGSKTPCIDCAGLANPPCLSSQSQAEPDGNYQEIGASMGGNSLTIRVHKDKNKIEQIDPNAVMSESNSESGGCCCTLGEMGKKKKKRQERSFNMRPGLQQGNEDLPFSFKVGKSGNPGGNNVMVNPPVATAPDGTKFTEFSDPNKELFILRVGKKSEGMNNKQNLELELCTPRGKAL